MFLVAQGIPELGEEADFEADFIGPYSELADDQLDRLRIERIVDEEQKELTSSGHKIEQRVKSAFSEDTLKFVSEIKAFLNDLSKDELLGFIYYSYPDMRVESTEFERIAPKRKEIGVSLFKKGKVSLGKAAIIAGNTQEDLIKILQLRGIPVFAE